LISVPVLDTHIWIWWLHGDPRLSSPVRAALDGLPTDRRPIVSDISLWEVAMLVALGRLQFGRSLESWLQLATNPRTVKVWPITASIAAEVAKLPDTFPRDPADRLIVATSRNRGAPLLTHDQRVIDSGLVSLWREK
jgi:PIN domain nuclease of toxin-antitoxin system